MSFTSDCVFDWSFVSIISENSSKRVVDLVTKYIVLVDQSSHYGIYGRRIIPHID